MLLVLLQPHVILPMLQTFVLPLTAIVILSCFRSYISHADNRLFEWYFNRSISQPLVYSAISPIEEDKPPAPLSVIQVINP